MQSAQLDPARRARFNALRRTIFAEMAQTSARVRLMWVVPFQGLVLALLVLRGQPHGRTLGFAACIVTLMALFAYQARRMAFWGALPNFMTGFSAFAVVLGMTGGVASPLVVTGLPILVSASVMLENPRHKAVFFGYVMAVILLLALASRTAIGELGPPLTPVGGWSSAEYVVLAAASFVFTAATLAKSGRHLTSAYERIAFELATRREEICSESEGRTRALEGMTARLAHEVKNPLAAIKGLSTHMARSASDPKTAERLSIVAAEADRLQAVVDGFLSFSRGLDELQLAPTRPYELARELSLLLETRAADAGVTLEVSGDTNLAIQADARKLRQALLNVVLNAMQASPAGQSVALRVERACPFQNGITLKVIDRGAGMTHEVLERIRKPYFTTREGGTGLGVAVARGLIEQHGGTLEFDSQPGRGTTVTIHLPAEPITTDQPAKLPKVACAPSCARTARQTEMASPESEAVPEAEAPAHARATAKV